MIKALLFDISRTLLFPTDKNYQGGLNSLYRELQQKENFNFLEHFELNNEALNYLDTVKNKVDLYIYTSESIQNDPAIIDRLLSIFKRIFSAKETGLSKKDPKSYEFIAKELNISPNEILFIDDSQENLDAAKIAGFNTLIYRDVSVVDSLKNFI